MNIVKVMLMKESCNLGRVHGVIEITHNHNLFMCVYPFCNEVTEVVKEKLTWAIGDVGVHKETMLL